MRTHEGRHVVGAGAPHKKWRNHIDASHSRQPLVKGERLVRYEVNAVMQMSAGTKLTKTLRKQLCCFTQPLPTAPGWPQRKTSRGARKTSPLPSCLGSPPRAARFPAGERTARRLCQRFCYPGGCATQTKYDVRATPVEARAGSRHTTPQQKTM